jgi:SPP1 gp7 family putative phage head morphogenesis protein
MPDPQVGAVPFEEAIKYFRDKVRLPTATWTDLWQAEHARAFVVAGAMKDELIKDLQSAVLKALEGGTTLSEFRKDFDTIVAAHGWSYRGGRNWRTRVIYNTNLRMAYAAGKYDQAQRLKKERPWMRYIAVDDGRTRELHRHWHNTVLPVDHEWWDTHYPPNGWNCRCTVQTLSGRDLKRYGIKVSEEAPPVELVDREVNFPDGRRTIQVPAGIDPGFGYNPGSTAYGKKLADDVMDQWRAASVADSWEPLTPGDWRSYQRPGNVPLDAPVAKIGERAASPEQMTGAIERAIGGKEKIFDLPDGSVVAVNAESLAGHIAGHGDRAALIPFLPELLTDPFEIWLSFERHKGTGRVELRKRIIKAVQIGDDKQALLSVIQAVKGRLEAWTFIPANRLGRLQRQRHGKLLFGRPEKPAGIDESGD